MLLFAPLAVFFGSGITWNFSCQNTRYSSRFSLNQSRNHVEATKGSHTRINIKSHQAQVSFNLHLMCVFMLPFEISGINWHNLETPWAISPKTQQQPPTAMCTAGVVCMYQRLSGRLLYWIQVWLLSTSSPLASNQGVTELCVASLPSNITWGKYVWNLVSVSSHRDNLTCKGHENEEMIV